MNLQPRDYQAECVQSVFNQWEKVKSTLVVVPTGGGKTIIFAMVIHRAHPKRAMVIAHREELIFQAVDKIQRTTGLGCEIEMASQVATTNLFNRTDVVVATVQTLCSGGGTRMQRFKPEDFGVLIIDECFPAGTLVDGWPIEKILYGDEVSTHLGKGTVTRLFRNSTNEIVDLEFSDGRRTVCTPNHPIWTPEGWRPAGMLTMGAVVVSIIPYEQMCNLPRTNEEQTLRKACLPFGVLQKNDSKLVPETWRRDNKVSQDQRDAQSSDSRLGVSETENDGMEADDSEGKWYRTNHSAAGVGGCARVENGGRYSNEDQERQWLSDLLQGGRWEFRPARGDRRGWELTQRNHAKGSGCEERRFASFARLVSRKVHKRGRGPEFERLCPGGIVYNFEVSNGNTYFANDILVHNCHHAVSSSYKKVIAHFTQNPELRVLGVTATPKRFDKHALKQCFETVAYDYEIADAIEGGWLVPLTQQLIRVKGLDFSQCRTQGEDFNGADLAQVMESEKALHGMVQPSLESVFDVPQHSLDAVPMDQWKQWLSENGKPLRAIAFTASVLQAKMLSEVFNRHLGKRCEYVHCETPKHDRRNILKSFASGETQIICNCGIFTEGFDDPGVGVIIMGRPTKSASLYQQMAGRSLRPLPGVVDGPPTKEDRRAAIAASEKPMARIVDFTANSGKHKLITTADILGGKVPDEIKARAKANLERDGKPKNIQDALKEAENELAEERRLAKEKREKEEQERRERLKARVDYTSRKVNPFDYSDGDNSVSPRSRDGRTFSPPQMKILREAGVDPSKINYNQGSAIIGKQMSIVSPSQRKVMVRAGYTEAEIKSYTRKTASKEIDRLASNGWRKPAPIPKTADVPVPAAKHDDAPPSDYYDSQPTVTEDWQALI